MESKEKRIIEDQAGRKIGEAEYLNGKPHGVTRVWNPDGVLTLEAEMDSGEYHGKYTSWWDNGQKKEEGQYHRGQKVGAYRWYSENGALIQEVDFGPEVL